MWWSTAHPATLAVASFGEKSVEPWKKATVFGAAHLVLQISVYIFGFALGPTMTTRKILGISFYDVAAAITLPFVYLSEHFEWKALGICVFPLNSFVWASAAYVILLAMGKLVTMKRNCQGR
jgi:hypothetical protein